MFSLKNKKVWLLLVLCFTMLSPLEAIPADDCATGGNYSLSGTSLGQVDTKSIRQQGNSLLLDTQVVPLDVSKITIPADQEVSLSFIYEGASTDTALGYFEKQLALNCLETLGSYRSPGGGRLPLPEIGFINHGLSGITLTQLAYYENRCAARGLPRFIKFALPFIQSFFNNTQIDGIFEKIFDRNNWCVYIPDHKLTFADINKPQFDKQNCPANINNRGIQPKTEKDYEDAGFVVNNDSVLTHSDSVVNLGFFKAGTELIFFLVRDLDTDITFFSDVAFNYNLGTNPVRNFRGISGWNFISCPGVNSANSVVSGNCNLLELMNGTCPGFAMPSTVNSQNPNDLVIDLDLGSDAVEDYSNRLTASNACRATGIVDSNGNGWKYDSYRQRVSWKQGFIPEKGRDAAENVFGVKFSGYLSDATNQGGILLQRGQPMPYFVGVAPSNDPYKWLIGVENIVGGGDADFNDALFLLERKTEGTAEMQASAALKPVDNDAYVSTVTLKIVDYICPGSNIDYFLKLTIAGAAGQPDSIVTLPITYSDWVVIKETSANGSDITNWSQGSPPTTYREARVDLLALGHSNVKKFTWGATFKSRTETCAPSIRELDISFNALKAADYSRSTPIPLANILYSPYFSTPRSTDRDRGIKGHLKASLLYDPITTLSAAIPPASSNYPKLWDAGEKLESKNTRTVFVENSPGILEDSFSKTVLDIKNDPTTLNAAVTVDFNNLNLPPLHPHILEGTFSMRVGIEKFVDKGFSLESNLGGTAQFDRYAGKVNNIYFGRKPDPNDRISVSYVRIDTTNQDTNIPFETVTSESLGLDKTKDKTGQSFIYDFNRDNTVDMLDAEQLLVWGKTRAPNLAFSNFASIKPTKRSALPSQNANNSTTQAVNQTAPAAVKPFWPLTMIDKSSMAIRTPPGFPGWFGKPSTDMLKSSIEKFICENRNAETVGFIGSGMGMIHAFSLGNFRPFHVDSSIFTASSACTNTKLFTSAINQRTQNSPNGKDFVMKVIVQDPLTLNTRSADMIINRGYYLWDDKTYKQDIGSGEEKWAYITSDMLAKIKNNYLGLSGNAIVEGSPSISNVRFADGTWHTIMVYTQGFGGDSVVALDVTDPLLDKPKLLWRYESRDLIRSISSPTIVMTRNNGNPEWKILFGSGVVSSSGFGYANIFIANPEKNPQSNAPVISKVSLGPTSIGAIVSGQPATIDSNGNGFADVLYVATSNGRVYKVLVPDSTAGRGFLVCGSIKIDENPPIGIYAPLSVAIRTVSVGSTTYANKPVIFFGTSDSPYNESDGAGISQFHLYGYVDSNPTSCTVSSLVRLSKIPLDTGHRVFAAPFMDGDKLIVGTSTAETSDTCAQSTRSDGKSGSVFSIDITKSSPQPFMLPGVTGNFVSSPSGSDKHVYLTSTGNLVATVGTTNRYQNQVKTVGVAITLPSSWREVTP